MPATNTLTYFSAAPVRAKKSLKTVPAGDRKQLERGGSILAAVVAVVVVVVVVVAAAAVAVIMIVPLITKKVNHRQTGEHRHRTNR